MASMKNEIPHVDTVAVVAHGPAGNAILETEGTQFCWNGPGATVRMIWHDSPISIDLLDGWAAQDAWEARQQVAQFSAAANLGGLVPYRLTTTDDVLEVEVQAIPWS